jgi:tetratricopeptide (TPR) repeat protein
VTFGEFRLDLETESVWRGTTEIRLRPKTFTLLRYLAEHPRRLLTKEELLDAVWPEVAVGEAVLAVCVGEIRRALADDPRTPRFIETVHRRGYRFIGADPTAAVPGVVVGIDSPAPDTPMIGREAEIVRLRQALEDAWQGRGRVVVIRGEAGIGKSRIVEEVAVEAAARGGRVLLGRCYETEQILPFGPWVNAVRQAGVLSEIGDLPSAWHVELSRLFPELGAAPPPDDHAQNVRLFEAVAHLVNHVAQRHPLLLVLEDVHWADEMSLRLAAFMARQIRARPVLMVVTAREEELPGPPVLSGLLEELARDDRAAQLTVGSLSRAETATLVRALGRACGDESALESLAEQLWTASKGNPFLVVETMRVVGDQPTPAVPLPERVRDVITARLARLSEGGQHLAAVASVIGREFDFAVLARAASLDEVRAAEGLEELARRRVLTGTGERFDFTHDRIREVAYGQLLPPRRRLLHAQVAAALEEVYRDALEPHYAALAAHHCEGEGWEQALTYFQRAGTRAVTCSANREAIAYLERGLQVLEHFPEGHAKIKHAYDLRMARASAQYSLGELQRIVEELGQTEALARALDDQTRVGRAAVLKLACLSVMGDQRAALEAGEVGRAIAEASFNRPREAIATVMLGFSHLGRGEFQQAIAHFRKSGDLLRDVPVHERFGQIGLPAVFWRTWLTLSLGELGAFPDAIACGEEAVRIADAADQPFAMAEAHGALGFACYLRGDLARGIAALERSVALCRDHQLILLSPVMIAALGHAYALSGRLAEAVSTAEEAVACGAALRVMWWQSRRLTQLGDTYLRAGLVDDARFAADRALALATAHGERVSEAYALRLRGAVAHRSHPTDVETAHRYVSQALTCAEELDMRPLVAHCHHDLGALYRHAGKRERAARHAATATTMYREMAIEEQGGHS